MANRMDNVRALIAATTSIRRESSQVEELTRSIAAKYEEMPKALAFVSKLMGTRLIYDRESFSLMGKTKKILREIAAENIYLNEVYERQLDTVARLEETLRQATLTPDSRAAYVTQLKMAQEQAALLKSKISGVNGELVKVQTILKPLAESADRMAEARALLSKPMNWGGMEKFLGVSFQINRSLIEANSSLTKRNVLLNSALKVGAESGVNMRTLAGMTEELVGLGLDLNGQYEDALRVTTKLVEGLGMSSSSAASLVATAKTANIEFRGLAKTISAIVDTTALAADEAARYARELSIAAKISMGTNRVDGAAFAQSLEIVAGVESALKGTTAAQGEIANALARFSSWRENGAMGTAYGTGGIDFLSREGAADRVIENIARKAAEAGPILIDVIAEQTQMSRSTISALGELYREQGMKAFEITPEMKERADFDRRYNEQIGQQGDAIRMLREKITFLLSKAVNPLINAINALLTKGVELAVKFGDMAWVSIPAMGVVISLAINSIVRLTRAIGQMAIAARIATAANVAAAAGGGAAGGAVRGLIGRISAGLATFFAGGAVRSIIGRGLGLLLGAVMTGGGSLIAGLAVAVIAQFWPNIVSFVKGKGWRTKAKEEEKPATSSRFSAENDARIKELTAYIKEKDYTAFHKKIEQIKADAVAMGATREEISAFRERARRATALEAGQFSGGAQLRQGVNLAQDRENVAVFVDMKNAINSMNETMLTFTKSQEKSEAERARRQAQLNEEALRRQATSSAGMKAGFVPDPTNPYSSSFGIAGWQ